MTKKFLQLSNHTGTANILHTTHLSIHLVNFLFNTLLRKKFTLYHTPDIENQNPGNAGGGSVPASGVSWVRPFYIL